MTLDAENGSYRAAFPAGEAIDVTDGALETISKGICHPERSPTKEGEAEGSRLIGLASPYRRDLLRQSLRSCLGSLRSLGHDRGFEIVS